MQFERTKIKQAKTALKTKQLNLYIARRLRDIIKQINKSEDNLIDYYQIRYNTSKELDRRLWRLDTYTSEKANVEVKERKEMKRQKSTFKARKSIMLLFGDKAASKVIYEQADEDDEESMSNVSKNSDSLPLRKARDISRVDGG